MISTGPMAMLQPEQMGERLQHQREALVAAGASRGRGVRYVYPTAMAIWDGAAGRAWVAADIDVDERDWSEILGILRMAGWMIGRPGYDDIGEPAWDRTSRVWVWSLACPPA